MNDPSLLWLSKDPIGISGGLNQYEAFGNNPVMWADPYGLQAAGPINGVIYHPFTGEALGGHIDSQVYTEALWGMSQSAAAALDGITPLVTH